MFSSADVEVEDGYVEVAQVGQEAEPIAQRLINAIKHDRERACGHIVFTVYKISTKMYITYSCTMCVSKMKIAHSRTQ